MPRLRVIGRQSEDDENRPILGSVAIADLGASYTLGRGELFLTIETGRSADGLINTAPRASPSPASGARGRRRRFVT